MRVGTACLPENASLKEQLRRESSQHMSELVQFEKQVAELDKQKTELRIEIVELELEKTAKLQECEIKCRELQDKLRQQELVVNGSQSTWEVQMKQLTDELEEV